MIKFQVSSFSSSSIGNIWNIWLSNTSSIFKFFKFFKFWSSTRRCVLKALFSASHTKRPKPQRGYIKTAHQAPQAYSYSDIRTVQNAINAGNICSSCLLENDYSNKVNILFLTSYTQSLHPKYRVSQRYELNHLLWVNHNINIIKYYLSSKCFITFFLIP